MSHRPRFGNRARHFDLKGFDDDAHVLMWIFFVQVFPHLRFHIVFPEIQNLPLVAHERLQHFPHVVAAVQNAFHFPGFQRQAFHDGEFQTCRRAPMANGRDFRQIKVVPPFRAVVGLDDTARRKQRGFERVVP
ncbi:MAG: hypothetical protein KGS61_21835, partial [Verrucomicrobia bacterium]|nr:hypothetical protein [Verrucomicrobiota bacterium]